MSDAKGGRPKKPCVNCEGVGQVLLMRTMFIQDGYRRERCGICAGTGTNPPGYRVYAGHREFLETANRRIAAWGGLKPKEEDLL